MKQPSLTDLKQIEELDLSNYSGRFIPGMLFKTNNEWKLWLNTDNGLIKMKGWPAEIIFLSDSDPESDDLNLHFLNFFYQRANYVSISQLLESVKDDILNLGASLAKLELISNNREQLKYQAARLITTEIEYIYQVCRSIFDLLQEIIMVLWNDVTLFDLKKKQLKKHFSDMIIKSEKIRSKEEIIFQFNLPEPIARFYTENAEFFQKLRATRNAIIHGGKSIDVVFVTERGFAVDKSKLPFSALYNWKEDECEPNNLGLLSPVIYAMVKNTITSCNCLSTALESCINFPGKIAPRHSVYLRGFHNKYLIKAITDT